MFWPEQSSTSNRRTKEIIPSVVTSNAWKEYHARKRNVKERLEQEKEARRKKREENEMTKKYKEGSD